MIKQIIFFLVIFSIFGLAAAQNRDEDISNFEALHVLGFGQVHDAALNPDNSMIAIASEQGVGVYSFPEFEIIQIFHRDYATAVLWTQNGQFLIGSGDGIFIWHLNENQTFTEVEHITSYSKILSLSPDEHYLVTADGGYYESSSMQVWRLNWSVDSMEKIFLAEAAPFLEGRPSYVVQSEEWAQILEIIWSSDSRHFVTVGSRIIYWTIENDQIIWERWFDDWKGEESHVLWSIDDKTIWHPVYLDQSNLEIGQVSVASQDQEILPGFGPVQPVAWLDNGQSLLTTYPIADSGPVNYTNQIQIWDVETRAVIREIELPFYYSHVLNISPDERYIITTNERQSLAVYELQSAALVAELVSHNLFGFDLEASWLSENRILAMLQADGINLYLWDVEREKIIDYVSFPTDAGAELSPNKRYLALGFNSLPLRIYEIRVENDHLRLILRHVSNNEFENPQWSGNKLAARQNDSEIRIWEFDDTGILTLCHRIPLEDIRIWQYGFGVDETQFTLAAEPYIRTYQLGACDPQQAPEIKWEISTDYYVYSMAWSAERNIFAYAYSPPEDTPSRLRFLDGETGELIQEVQNQDWEAVPSTLEFSPDGQYLAIGYRLGKLEVVKVDEPQRILANLRGHYWFSGDGNGYGSIDSLEWSPNGERLLSFSDDDTIHIWGEAD